MRWTDAADLNVYFPLWGLLGPNNNPSVSHPTRLLIGRQCTSLGKPCRTSHLACTHRQDVCTAITESARFDRPRSMRIQFGCLQGDAMNYDIGRLSDTTFQPFPHPAD